MASAKQARLDQIAAEIIARNICPDLAKTAKQLVFGEDNPLPERCPAAGYNLTTLLASPTHPAIN